MKRRDECGAVVLESTYCILISIIVLRTKIQEDTEMKNFPLYCPKCKKETIINVQDMKITLAVSK